VGIQIRKAKAAGTAMTATMSSTFIAPFDGYLYKVAARGAGAESMTLSSNRVEIPDQVVPIRDMAINTDPLELDFVELNQPVRQSEVISISFTGTGTAAVSVVALFTRAKLGEWHVWKRADADSSTLAAGDSLMRVPGGAELLAKVLARFVDLEAISIKVGESGSQQDILGRDIAANTDAEPFAGSIQDIMETSPENHEILCVAVVGGTGGAGNLYCAFQMSDEASARATGV